VKFSAAPQTPICTPLFLPDKGAGIDKDAAPSAARTARREGSKSPMIPHDIISNMRFLTTAIAILSATAALAQTPTVAVRAGHLFDPKSGEMLANQVIVIHGDRIEEVGANLAIPAGAKVIDLSHATVLPGLIDGHVHLTDAGGGLQHQVLVGLHSATDSMHAGFTTLVVMGSHGGGYADVELKKAIESGLIHGPRLITAGPVIEITGPAKDIYPLEFKPFEPALIANGPNQMRLAVRELSHYGVDHVKMLSTGPFYFKKDGEMVNQPLMSLEELKAAVDEAHTRGLWVATHTYGGPGLKWAIEAGVDNIQHAIAADDDDIRQFVAKKIPITSTILDQRQDEPGDLKQWAPYSRWRLMRVTWKKMMDAGVILGFGSGAAPPPGRVYNAACNCSHGVQAEMFPVFVSWGAAPLYTLRMATTVNAQILHMEDRLGTVEKGKFADLIAVAGNPLQDISEMQRVKFVMKGGIVERDDWAAKP
jgi:imidazolonepropionase-like amidohydrolase